MGPLLEVPAGLVLPAWLPLTADILSPAHEECAPPVTGEGGRGWEMGGEEGEGKARGRKGRRKEALMDGTG